jgi:hypothetical protein
MTATQQTNAEIKARAMARLLEEAGFEVEVEVKIEPHAARYFTDGGVMLAARVHVHVHAHGNHLLDDGYNFGFVSWLPAEGHRASTKYSGGHLYHPLRIRGRYSKKVSLRELRDRISSEVSSARYAKSQEV